MVKFGENISGGGGKLNKLVTRKLFVQNGAIQQENQYKIFGPKRFQLKAYLAFPFAIRSSFICNSIFQQSAWDRDVLTDKILL